MAKLKLSLDISGFNVRAVPHTRGLNRQKLIGADSVTAFWYDCLREGAIAGTGETTWPADIVTQVLHAAYLDHARDHGERHPATDARMAERLGELCQGCQVRRIRPRKPHAEVERPLRYALASLTEHRSAFLTAMGISEDGHDWQEIEEAADGRD